MNRLDMFMVLDDLIADLEELHMFAKHNSNTTHTCSYCRHIKTAIQILNREGIEHIPHWPEPERRYQSGSGTGA